MAVLNICDENRSLTTADEICRFLEPHGIWYERWQVAGRIADDADSDAILSAYKPEIDRLKERGGYVTADIINVNASTPGLDAMLDRFNKEHTHSEDEVRFVVKGRGIFHIHPVHGSVFSIEMEAGDLINVPAGTKHWFNLCSDKTIQTIRLFEDTAGWTPHYIETSVHEQYQPLCMGPSDFPKTERVDPKIKV